MNRATAAAPSHLAPHTAQGAHAPARALMLPATTSPLTRARRLLLCGLALVLVACTAACTESPGFPAPSPDDYGDKGPIGSDPEDDFQRAGTGSAGGNPLTFTFDTAEDDDANEGDLNTLIWQPPSFHIDRVTVQDPSSPSGACNAAGPIRLLQLSDAFATDTAEGFAIAAPLPCSITLRPAADAPFLTANASLGALGPLNLALHLPQGLIFDVHHDAAPLADPDLDREVYVLIDPSALLHRIEPTDLLGAEALFALGQAGDNPLRDRLIENLLASLTVYLDPTPGDGLILPEERVEANVFATLSLGRKIGSSKAAP